MRGEQLFRIEASVRLPELCMALMWNRSQFVILWHFRGVFTFQSYIFHVILPRFQTGKAVYASLMI